MRANSYRRLLFMMNIISLLFVSINTTYRMWHGVIAPRLHHFIVHEVVWVDISANIVRIEFINVRVQIWLSAIGFHWCRFFWTILLFFGHVTLLLQHWAVFGPISFLPLIFKCVHFFFDFDQLLCLFVNSQIRWNPCVWLFLFRLSSLVYRWRYCSLDLTRTVLLLPHINNMRC